MRFSRFVMILLVGALSLGSACASGARGGGGTDTNEADSGTDSNGEDANETDTDDDVGTDAGEDVSGDAENDAPEDAPACAMDEDCGDGNPCNGEETCEDGTCQVGTSIVCESDDIPCTIDECNPSTGMCESNADDSLCPVSQTCTPTGCQDLSCDESPCRLLSPQCGCGTDLACRISSGTTRGCFPAGPGRVGDNCESTECEAGLTCIGFTGTTAQHCRAYCNSSSDCSGAGSACVLELTGQTQLQCTVPCAPTDTTACSGGRCGVFTDSGLTFTDCAASSTATHGQSCIDSRCAPGHSCVNYNGVTQCLRYCARSPAGGECGLDACVPFGTPAVVGGVEYGVCEP